jgi:Zn-dependent peptidase ImmA (M78 family)/O-acetyl-ADP-ribose deacetylase (regulator of RNase III)
VATMQWTNPSVKKFAGDFDPTAAIIKRARSFVLDLIDSGWQGPPFDIFAVAKHMCFSLIPSEDVFDARITFRDDQIVLEYNPNKPMSRIRFSIAHEIAHTFFSDFKESMHNRNGHSIRPDDWQLELLCNIAASEILMPIGVHFSEDNLDVNIKNAKIIRDKFGVSLEAALLRLGKLTTKPITVFAAAREENSKKSDFRVDYVLNSSQSTLAFESGMRISKDSVLSECTEIGYTAIGKSKLLDNQPEVEIECVGVAPYPNSLYPRVLGIIKTEKKNASEPISIKYVIGDALEPRGNGRRILAHIINDSAKNWGRGFASSVATKWPDVARDFHKWVAEDRSNLKLGNSHLSPISEDLAVFHMVAQHGYGPSTNPRIRYESLAKCLESLADLAREMTATVHMPKIGTGYAGGNWAVISDMINEALIEHGVEITVYELPGRERPRGIKSLSDYWNPLDS